MTPAQWGEWIAFDRLDPIGEVRADRRNAMLLAHILRMLSAMGGGDSSAIDERNFLPYLHELQDVPAQDPRLTRLALEMLSARFNTARS